MQFFVKIFHRFQKFHFHPDIEECSSVRKQGKEYSNGDISHIQAAIRGETLNENYGGDKGKADGKINGHFPEFPEAGFFVQIVAMRKGIEKKVENN